ncbi:hypothetical protein EV1_016936 [Malus domestica]
MFPHGTVISAGSLQDNFCIIYFNELSTFSFRNTELHFGESPALAPPEVQIDMAVQAKHEQELIDAATQTQPLPADDNELF